MFELAKHIESLLLKNDCVVVPRLGGFVTRYVPARWVAEENLFLPPYRSVGFNAQLTINDGLLVQSYMQANDTSYPDTLKLVDRDVTQVKEMLQREGEFVFDGIGKLLLRLDGHYDFVPLEAGVISPELYGLDAFTIVPCTNAPTATTVPTRLLRRSIPVLKAARQKSRMASNRVRRAAMQTAVAAVTTLLFYFMWSAPLGDTTVASGNQASVAENLIFSDAKPPTPHRGVAQKPLTVQAAPTEKPAQSPTAETVTPQPVETDPSTPVIKEGYALVLASSITMKNAKTYTEQLKADGYKDAFVYRKNKMVRVLYGHYTDEATAYARLNEFRSRHEFADAWVIQLK